jgi:hypothetical protein
VIREYGRGIHGPLVIIGHVGVAADPTASGSVSDSGRN